MGKFVYQTEEYTEKGIFFRSPIQKVYYDLWEGPWFPRGLHALLNLNRYFKCKKAVKEVDNLAGFDFFEFAWPVYFTRKSRETVASKQSLYEYSDDDKANTKAVFVGSYGEGSR